MHHRESADGTLWEEGGPARGRCVAHAAVRSLQGLSGMLHLLHPGHPTPQCAGPAHPFGAPLQDARLQADRPLAQSGCDAAHAAVAVRARPVYSALSTLGLTTDGDAP